MRQVKVSRLRCALPLRSTAARLSFLLVLVLCAVGGAAHAQSGRRAPRQSAPPEPQQSPPPAEAESESIPRPSRSKPRAGELSLLVFENDNPLLNIPLVSPDIVLESFVRRLGDSPDVRVERGGKLDRRRARDRAKAETDTYVVLLELEEEAAQTGRGSIGRVDPADLVVKYYVYTPATAALKVQGQVYQRPSRSTTRIGGVRVPLPTPPRGRTAIEDRLEQAGRDAADRVLAAFNVRRPPDRY